MLIRIVAGEVAAVKAAEIERPATGWILLDSTGWARYNGLNYPGASAKGAEARLRPGFLFLWGASVQTIIYVDGFNLYYGALKRTPYRWLDLAVLCSLLLPRHTITRIKYFTAIVKPLPRDPDQPVRQQAYLRALETLPDLEIIYGQFLSHVVRMPLANGAGFVDVLKAEEKGTDVALATHLLHDAHLGAYDAAVIVSNDSDLVPPIRIVRSELGKSVGILCPRSRPAYALLQEADFIKRIRPSVLRASQFPPVLTDAVGTFYKPPSW